MNLPCLILGLWCTSGTVTGAAYVHDGDTIYIARQAYRLRGVDAEELDEPHGQVARDHLRQLVAGREVTCFWEDWSYNRRVAQCFTGPDLGAQMIRDGYALDCKTFSGGQYRSLEPMGARVRLIQKVYCK